jgi:hypothetical protein
MNLLCDREKQKKRFQVLSFRFQVSSFRFQVSGSEVSCFCQAERSRGPFLLEILRVFTAKHAKVFYFQDFIKKCKVRKALWCLIYFIVCQVK